MGKAKKPAEPTPAVLVASRDDLPHGVSALVDALQAKTLAGGDLRVNFILDREILSSREELERLATEIIAAEAAAPTVTVGMSVDGYDHDVRELFQIPDVVDAVLYLFHAGGIALVSAMGLTLQIEGLTLHGFDWWLSQGLGLVRMHPQGGYVYPHMSPEGWGVLALIIATSPVAAGPLAVSMKLLRQSVLREYPELVRQLDEISHSA